MKKPLIAILAVGIIATGAYIMISTNGPQPAKDPKPAVVKTPVAPAAPKEVTIRAAFMIFTNGTIRIFTDPKYHSRSADVFITPETPNVLLVKKAGITWQQFFDTLPAPMKVSQDCLMTGTGQSFCNGSAGTLRFYLNGTKVDDLLTREIKSADKALISYGPNEAQLSGQLQAIPNP